jgi:hypothetical protein
MAVFISVSVDPFEEVFAQAQSQDPQVNVRRPLRGIQITKDTYAVLRVLTATNEEIPLIDSSSPYADSSGRGYGFSYSNFIIQQLAEQRVEKQQIVETFGEDYIFFFGERPRFINIQGVLLNTQDFNWKSEFWANYDRYLRGTKLVEQNARLYLYFNDVVIEGYIIQAATQQDAGSPYHLQFNFQMFVTNYAILSSVGSVFFQNDAEAAASIPAEGLVPLDEKAQAEMATAAAREGAGGGLLGFLSTTSQFLQNASFKVQSTLANIRDTFYGRQVVFPDGLGAAVYTPPIQNLARFDPAPINQPIHMMHDEYPERGPTDARFDEDERTRVRKELRLRSPEELENRARAALAEMGIDTTRREAEYLLLGRAAFAGLQTVGSFGIRQVDWKISGTMNQLL